MKLAKRLSLLITIAALVVSGCDSTKSDNPAGKPAQSDDQSHSHDDGTSHSHAQDSGAAAHDHEHSSGPNGGVLVDWGGGSIHVELVFDHGNKQVTAYTFGSDAATVLPIEATEIILAIKEPKMHLVLQAKPQSGDGVGKNSRFAVNDEQLAEKRAFEGSVSGVVEGTPFSGNFKKSAD